MFPSLPHRSRPSGSYGRHAAVAALLSLVTAGCGLHREPAPACTVAVPAVAHSLDARAVYVVDGSIGFGARDVAERHVCTRLAGTALLLSGLAATAAPASEYAGLRPELSALGVSFHEFGLPVRGRAARFDAQIAFDSAHPERACAQIAVALDSVEFDSPRVNAAARTRPWFDVDHYPMARFRATEVAVRGPDRFEMTGTMTLKGRTRPVVVPVTVTPRGAVAMVRGTIELRRRDFDIGTHDWRATMLVSDAVVVEFTLAVPAACRPGACVEGVSATAAVLPSSERCPARD